MSSTTKNKINVTEDQLFQDFILERNLSENSVKGYIGALQSYTTYHQMTLTQLIDEADEEEEEGVRAKNRTIIKRLKSYRTHLLQNDTEPTTITGYYTKIKTFYRHNLIEIPYIPAVKLTQKQVMYEELPHKEHLIEALNHTNNLKHKAIIIFMASSGTARQETYNLTVQDFIQATYEYHNTTNIQVALETLEKKDNVIPIFQLTRQKTGYRYYTCCTPEAVTHIIRYLKSVGYKNLQPEDRLFDIKIRGINKLYTRINNRCKYPKGFLHPHSMRKYQADIINDRDLVDMLQGRKPNVIREAYFKSNPQKLKEEYKKHIENLTLKSTKFVTIESEEVKKLKRQLKEKDEMFRKLESQVHDMQKEQDKWEQMFQQFNEKYNK